MNYFAFTLVLLFFAGIQFVTKSALGVAWGDSIRTAEPRWVVTPHGKNLPSEVQPQHSNNNVSIVFHKDRLFMAFRSAPTHFASDKTVMWVMSSTDYGRTWQFEHKFSLGTDVREPLLVSFQGRLLFYFFKAGKKATSFSPKQVWLTERISFQNWDRLVPVLLKGEVPWEIKVRGRELYLSSYLGDHYSIGRSKIQIRFQSSTDGVSFRPAYSGRSSVYEGGASEVAFEWDQNDQLWAVTRNEDGDRTGFGSHLVKNWNFPKRSNPNRYDSPRMFRYEDEVYLIARRDMGGPFDQYLFHLPFAAQKWANLIAYSLRKKRTALYRIDRIRQRVVHLMELPSAGDNAFPSLAWESSNQLLVANYSSPFDMQNVNWIKAQVSKRGTGIYLQTIEFK